VSKPARASTARDSVVVLLLFSAVLVSILNTGDFSAVSVSLLSFGSPWRGNEKPCRSVKVFCSQLPRTNRFYSYEPSSVESEPTWKATSRCRGCKQV
jgi:hypothetical protein